MVKKIPSNLVVERKVPFLNYDQFVELHKSQLNQIPKLFWKTLYDKLINSIFDLDQNIQLDIKKITYPNEVKKEITVRVINKNGLRKDDAKNIFLINHLMHFCANEGRELVKNMINNRSPLINYLKKLMNINDNNVCTFINKLLDQSWKFVIPFSVRTKSKKKSIPIWSITEPIGMLIRHSFNPNFQMVTFQYLNLKRIYSVLFPIVPIINYNDEVTRDYTLFFKFNYEQIKLNAQMQQDFLDQQKNTRFFYLVNEINLNSSESISETESLKWTTEKEVELLKQTLILPWKSETLLDHYYQYEKINYQQNEPSILEFFHKRGFIEPYSMIRCEPTNLKCLIAAKNQIKVYCDHKPVINYLTDEKYVFVQNPDLADIWWYNEPFFEFSKMYKNNPNVLINQFPLGHLLADKSVLPALCRRNIKKFNGNFDPYTLESYPLFIPTTFDLNTELVKFVSYFTKREQKKLDNYWIVKPKNRQGSSDLFITNNLNAVIRIQSSGARVACKYISSPLLFYRSDIMNLVKFELRYFVVLTSVLPLKLFVYRAFQVDFANKPFDLTKNLYNQEMHLTDMRVFNDQVGRLDIDHIDFINRFNNQFQFADFDFDKIDNLSMTAIKELFQLSTELFPFAAINPNPASSALYQIDIVLSWIESSQLESNFPIKSNIIEVNQNPNCDLICEKHKNFYNDLFDLMFLNNEENCNFRFI